MVYVETMKVAKKTQISLCVYSRETGLSKHLMCTGRSLRNYNSVVEMKALDLMIISFK